jgi:hypothetical protein
MNNTTRGSWRRDPAVVMEMILRRLVWGQTYGHIAKVFGLPLSTVYPPLRQVDEVPNDNPELRELVTAKLTEELGTPSTGGNLSRTQKLENLSPDQQTELGAEIGGMIDLCRQAAALFGITTRRFIHLALTDMRSL